MIVVRPAEGERVRPETAVLSPEAGVEGDHWASLGADTGTQVTLINVRVLALAAGGRERWPLAGDQVVPPVATPDCDDPGPHGTVITISRSCRPVLLGAERQRCDRLARRAECEPRPIEGSPHG